MKSYYEIEKDKIKEYKKEFKETPGGNVLEKKKIIVYSLFFTSLTILFFYYFILLVLTSKNFQTDYSEFLVHIGLYNVFLLIMSIVTLIFKMVYCYCFASWLKVKHKIHM